MRYVPLLCLLLIMAQPSTAQSKYLQIHEPGAKRLHFALPSPCHFSIKLPNGRYSQVAAPSLGMGGSYTYAANRFVWLNVGLAVTAKPGERKDPDYYWDESALSTFITLRNNHVIRNIVAGYGISFSHFNQESGYYNRYLGTDSLQQVYNSDGVGFCLSGQYHPLHFMSLGLLYQPQVYSLQHGFGYQHVMALEMILSVPLSRRPGWVRPTKEG
ncbi:hypothetical protein [Polluticoccus soli]|uniref:hypothetical protein n=1 Tax=Polluticoccus soli TaxID=3034150 RepID=UPI0023E0A05E|nr:hypothetical protein [Flavipsychrobacter sp. JY13-12]